jgi:hypothetical protein
MECLIPAVLILSIALVWLIAICWKQSNDIARETRKREEAERMARNNHDSLCDYSRKLCDAENLIDELILQNGAAKENGRRELFVTEAVSDEEIRTTCYIRVKE